MNIWRKPFEQLILSLLMVLMASLLTACGRVAFNTGRAAITPTPITARGTEAVNTERGAVTPTPITARGTEAVNTERGAVTPIPMQESAAEPTPAQWLVVGVKGGDLYAYEAGGDRQLTYGGNDDAPVISPDGSVILFERAFRFGDGAVGLELHIINADGSDERRVLGPEELDSGGVCPRLPIDVAWLPDNRTIAFGTTCTGGLTVPEADLWLADVETGGVTQLLGSGQGGTYAFSPDGSVVLVGAATEVLALNVDGSNRRTLLSFERVAISFDGPYYPTPVWASDGSYALVAIPLPEGGGSPITEQTSFELWQLLPDGDAVLLSTTPDSLDAYVTPQWSPDRSLIAYNTVGAGSSSHHPGAGMGKAGLARQNRRPLRGGPEPYHGDLVIASADGGGPVVYETQALFLGWLPDSRRFLFLDSKRTGTEMHRRLGEVMVGQLGESAIPLVPPEAIAVKCVQWMDQERFVYVSLVGDWASPSGSVLHMGHLNDVHLTLFHSSDPYEPWRFDTHPQGMR